MKHKDKNNPAMARQEPKRVMIQTLGCQMNVYDSEKMQQTLAEMGYAPVDSPWKADLVIVNTCAIREKAEQKVMSSVGRLCGIKRRRPHMAIAVAGCVAQYQSEKIFKRFDGVDLILGTRVIHRLADHVRALEQGRGRIVDVEMPDKDADKTVTEPEIRISRGTEPEPVNPAPPRPESGISRFVTIMRGCDNFCAYCVVPYVRGRETSRRPEDIIGEVRDCVDAGAREITLLGQNVNSYGKKEGLCTFAELLERVGEINGLERIRFVTSHPKDLSDELVTAFSRLDKLCNHIHLPVQSGANPVLKRMNRKYTREMYLERLEKLRSVRPDIAVTSDFIVGFPGETSDDFEITLDLLRTVEFDTLFAFEYSDRSLAPARRFSPKIDDEQKHHRLRQLLDCQAQITRRIYAGLAGQSARVLVEGFSKRSRQMDLQGTDHEIEMSGRTSENRIVNFSVDPRHGSPENLVGSLVDVVIERACANSLKGAMTIPEAPVVGAITKGGKTHAA